MPADGEPRWLHMLQVFRTEHWARILGNNSSLSLMSVGERQINFKLLLVQMWLLCTVCSAGRLVSRAHISLLTCSVPAAPARPPAVLTTTMLFSAVAAGATHPDALASILHHPSTGLSMLTASSIPWHQVGS